MRTQTHTDALPPPLQPHPVQILARNPAFRLSLVKDFISRHLQSEGAGLRTDQEESEWLKVCMGGGGDNFGRRGGKDAASLLCFT